MMGWRVFCLTLLTWLTSSYSQSPCVLITPAVLRVGSEETIVLDAPGQSSAFDTDILIKDFPQKTNILFQGNVSMNSDNNFLGTAKIILQPQDLRGNKKTKQFVNIEVRSSVCSLEKVILLSLDSGYIFIQTDKPIYTPGSPVMYRIFTTNTELKPVDKAVIIEILNPEGIILLRQATSKNINGVISNVYHLSDSLGVWTISVRYEDNQKHYTTNFEVKEYVPNTIKVVLKAEQNYFYINDEDFTVDIQARYLSGNPVDGKAFVLFGIKKDNEKKNLTDSLRRVEITDGEGFAVLDRTNVIKYFKKADDMLAYTLYVTVSILSESGNDMVESHLENIPFVTSPFKIFFTKTPRYFKPGLPFDLRVLVTNPDGTPASQVPVVADPGGLRGITRKDGVIWMKVNTPPDLNSHQITVKTAHRFLPAELQSTASFVATAKRPVTGNDLLIDIPECEIKPEASISVKFIFHNKDLAVQNQIQHFTYMILNKGRILKVARQARGEGQPLVTIPITITKEFVPSFRVVAYYIVTTSVGTEIVSDSIWVDVTDSCMGTLEVTANTKREKLVMRPGEVMRLKLRADYKAVVGLVAVDQGVYEHNKKFKMSQKKVWDLVEKSDFGCTPGSGADSLGVFYDAGLALQSNFKVETRQRTELQCDVNKSRRRRSVEEEDNYIPSWDIMSRTEFPYSWFWLSHEMVEKPDKDGVSTKVLSMFLKDSITTWEFLAVSLSEKGICVAEPYEIEVRKNFLIDLKLPYSVVRNEQVEIRAVIYNYRDSRIKVQVILSYNPNFCSLSSPGRDYQQVVQMKPYSSATVPFVITPLEMGCHNVEVKAAVYGEFIVDGVTKKLRVVPEGIRVTETLMPVILDPSARVIDDFEKVTISAKNCPLSNENCSIVPRTDTTTIVTIRGVPPIKTAEDPVNGINLIHLIREPSSQGERIVMDMSMNLAAVYYLDATNQWEDIDVNYREKTNKHITNDGSIHAARDDYDVEMGALLMCGLPGYIKELTFSKFDNSYEIANGNTSSTWLTSFVVKVFGMAGSKILIDNNIVCSAIKWLMLQQQIEDGVFIENAPISFQALTGGLHQSPEPNAVLTAYVLIAILENKEICDVSLSTLQESVNRASLYLEHQYSSLSKPYSIAITSYALSLAGKLRNTARLMSAATDKSHWDETDSRLISLEATSYALLTLLQIRLYDLTGPIVRWLYDQRFYGADNNATQATIIMFQALAQYHSDVPPLSELKMNITVKFSNRVRNELYTVEDALIAHTFQTIANQDIVVMATGMGQATLSVMWVYHLMKPERETTCNNFDLSVALKTEPLDRRPVEAKKTVYLTICVRHLKSVDASMAILDITMLTGFYPDINYLNMLNRGLDNYIADSDIKRAAERSNLIIYLDKISHVKEQCIQVRVHQFFEVALIQPASVTVYEYYTPENRCTKFYHVEQSPGVLDKVCHGGVCRCADYNCYLPQPIEKNVDVTLRLEKTCSEVTNYAYKVTLVDMHQSDDTFHIMEIQKVIKHGSDSVTTGENRTFISHTNCQKYLNLAIGTNYLIWGMDSDLWKQASGNLLYLIGKDTWIEWWPKETECGHPQNQKICDDLRTYSEKLELINC